MSRECAGGLAAAGAAGLMSTAQGPVWIVHAAQAAQLGITFAPCEPATPIGEWFQSLSWGDTAVLQFFACALPREGIFALGPVGVVAMPLRELDNPALRLTLLDNCLPRSLDSQLQSDLQKIPDCIAAQLLTAIPDQISDDLFSKLNKFRIDIKDKRLGSDGKLYGQDVVMPGDVRSLGPHPFSQWDGDQNTLKDVLKGLLSCPIDLELIKVPVIMVTGNGVNTQAFERKAVAEMIKNSTRHPLTREVVVGLALDEGRAQIIALLLQHHPEQAPAQQSMADPTAPLLAPPR